MIDYLKFVMGAVSLNDKVVPVLTHYCITGKRIQGANGRISIDAPAPDLDFDAVVPAERFLKGVDACGGKPELKLTEAGRMSIKGPGFRALLTTHPVETFPKAAPSGGKVMPVKGAGFVETLRILRPFIAEDAERPWASTIYFDSKNSTAFAANNAMIAMAVSKPFGADVQLPVFAIDELIRIGEPPTRYAIDPTSITFWWGEDRWLKAQLIVAEWPTATAQKWFEMKAKMIELPKGLGAIVERLLPFCPDPKFPIIHLNGSKLSTAPGESQAEMDIKVKIGEGAFHADNLRPMLAHATSMAITERAALFNGEGFRGVMSLLRVAK